MPRTRAGNFLHSREPSFALTLWWQFDHRTSLFCGQIWSDHRTSLNTATYLASERGFLGLSWSESEGRCYCCSQESLGNCYWENEETDGCWVAGKNPGKWRWVACEAHFVLSSGTELRGCAEDYIHCVLEPVLEEELEKGKEKKRGTKMRMMKIVNNVTIKHNKVET